MNFYFLYCAVWYGNHSSRIFVQNMVFQLSTSCLLLRPWFSGFPENSQVGSKVQKPVWYSRDYGFPIKHLMGAIRTPFFCLSPMWALLRQWFTKIHSDSCYSTHGFNLRGKSNSFLDVRSEYHFLSFGGTLHQQTVTTWSHSTLLFGWAAKVGHFTIRNCEIIGLVGAVLDVCIRDQWYFNPKTAEKTAAAVAKVESTHIWSLTQ